MISKICNNKLFIQNLEAGKKFPKSLLVETIEDGPRRYTTPQGKVYPSVSTIMGYSPEKDAAISRWKKRVGEKNADHIRNTASQFGNSLHNSAEYYLSNQTDKLHEELKSAHLIAKQMFFTLKTKLDLYVDNIHSLETPMYSDILRTAGRTDCIAEWNGVLSVIDFKNSKKKKKQEYIQDYIYQTTCYACMAKEFLKIPISQIVIPICYYDGSIDVFVGKTNDHYSGMKRQIDFYYENHPEMLMTE